MLSVYVGEPDLEIVELECRIRAAQMKADIAELSALISDDLLFTGPDGSIGTKDADLQAHASGVVKFRDHIPRELRVRRVEPNVAIVALLAELAVEVAGQLMTGTYRYTRVWAREAGAWQVTGGHVSKV